LGNELRWMASEKKKLCPKALRSLLLIIVVVVVLTID
jgi:hypothetical protein